MTSTSHKTAELSRRSALLIGAGAGLGAATGGQARADDATFRLGWVRPSTGRIASSFAPLFAGGLVAVDEINAAGGIAGRKIVREEADDEASPAKEPAVIKRLLESGVQFVVGPTGSSQALASLAFTTPNRMVQTTFAATVDVGDARKYPYHYQFVFNTETEAELGVTYVVDKLKIRKIGILHENTAFGQDVTAGCRRVLTRYGFEPAGVEAYPLTAPDLDSYVSNLRKAGAEAVLFWGATIPQAAMALNSMHNQQWHPVIAGHTTLLSSALYGLVPVGEFPAIYAAYYKSLTWTASETPGELQQQFARDLARYPEAKGTEPVATAAPYYDFIRLLKSVIEQSGTFDPVKVKAAMDAVSGYQGLLGRIRFTPESHAGIGLDQVAMASVKSLNDPRAKSIFRERAPG